jgi:hypothetical protein
VSGKDPARPNAWCLSHAWEDVVTGTPDIWVLTAILACADPLPGLELVTSSSFNNSFSYKSAEVTCSAGKQVLSAAGTGSVGTSAAGGAMG